MKTGNGNGYPASGLLSTVHMAATQQAGYRADEKRRMFTY